MRIAVDCRMYSLSGIGTYIREILPYLIESNHTFLLLGNENELSILKTYQNVEIQECNISIFSIKELFLFPVKLINSCDIFYTPYYNIPGRIKIPIYSTIHDVLFLDMPELTSKIGYLIRKIFYKRAYYLSNKIFTVSNFSKRRIQLLIGKEKEIIVTYNGLSEYIIKKENKEYEKKDYIIYVGNIKKHKGLKTLLDAYQMFINENGTSDLIIVGNQNNFKTKDTEIIKYLNKTSDNIVFTGYVNTIQLKKLIAEAKVLVQPSLYEGFGIPPLEALALGTPVIISDIDVFKELYPETLVNFFSTGDSFSLKNILHNIKPINQTINFNDKFNYENVAKIILNAF